MALKDISVEPLFAEPIFRANIGDVITQEQIDFIKNLKMVENQTNLISDNLYIFELPELKSIKDAVQEALDTYARDVMGVEQSLYVTQSWSLMNEPGRGMHGHSHSNSVVSGSLYFCDMPEPVAGMIFDRHKTYQLLQLNAVQGKRNVYNTPFNIIVPKKNDILLFASDLQHLVETNKANEPRYSISFNAFVKGKLGSYRDVSELTL